MNRIIALLYLFVVTYSLGCDSLALDGRIGEPLSRAETPAFTGRWIDKGSDVVDVHLRVTE